MPNRASERAALDFATKQEGWLRKALSKRPVQVVPAFGDTVPYLGRNLPVLTAQGRSISVTDEGIFVPGNAITLAARLKGFFKVCARDQLAAASQRHAARLGREIGQITLRDTKTRWGSCTESGNLMYSWRLVMAPPEVLDYVAAHEVSHLLEMNHSRAFWAVVGRLMPDYEIHRAWLKANGSTLHQVRF